MENIIIPDEKIREQIFAPAGSIGEKCFNTNPIEFIELNDVCFCDIFLEIKEKYIMVYEKESKIINGMIEREKLKTLYIKKEEIVSETVEKEFKF